MPGWGGERWGAFRWDGQGAATEKTGTALTPGLGNEARILDAAGAMVGIVPVSLRRRERLTGPNILEQIQVPQEYTRDDGTPEARWWMIDQGYQLLYEGGRYLIDVPETDFETGGTLTATSAEVELQNFDTNYSPGPATYLNRTPTDILTAVLSGKVGRLVRNPGFGILDADGLPTNWTHPAGWTSQLVSNRRVWQAPASAWTDSLSDLRPCTPGVSYRVAVDINAPVGLTGYTCVRFRWRKTDGTTVDSAPTVAALTGTYVTVETPSVVALGNKVQIGLSASGTDQPVCFDDVRLYEVGPDTGWSYVGSMDARPAAIPFTDGAIVKYGVWTKGASDLSATTADDYIGRVINGPFVTVNFAAGGAGARAKIRVNGVIKVASLDVSGATSYTVNGLDPANDHIVEVEVAAVKVAVTGFVVSAVNLISMRWDYKTVYEAVASVAKAVGGELSFDTVAKTITHQPSIGMDLRVTNVVDFRRDTNLVKFTRRHDRTGIVNRLTGLGYGQGEYQLVVTVDATGVNADGATSQSLYGVRRGKTTNSEWKDLATAVAESQRIVEAAAFGANTYTTETTDATAALCAPGDTAHFLYRDEEVSLRILEISRDNDSGTATLTVGDKAEALEDVVAGTRRDLATLQKSYQGVPSDTNDSFSEQFDRTTGGVDTPAACSFFIPYGADLMDLRARYQIGGMRATAKSASVAAAGASTVATTPSSTTDTSGGGGATVATQAGQTSDPTAKTTADGATPSSTTATVFTSVAPSRIGYVLNAWLTIIVNSPGSAGMNLVRFTIMNLDASAHTFTWEMRANSDTGTLVATNSVSVPGMGSYQVSQLWNSYYTANAYCRAKQTDGSTVNFATSAVLTWYGPHDHGSHAHGMGHTHPVPGHAHTLLDHYHSLNDHQHGMQHDHGSHTHNLVYGIVESGTPATVRVYLDGTLIAALNDLVYVTDFDLMPYLAKDGNGRAQEGWRTLEFRTATNGGTGSVRGSIFASKFLSTEGV